MFGVELKAFLPMSPLQIYILRSSYAFIAGDANIFIVDPICSLLMPIQYPKDCMLAFAYSRYFLKLLCNS